MEIDPGELEAAFATMLRAGQHPSSDVLEGVRRFGSDAIPGLIEIAVSQELNTAPTDSPEVWAPLHAVQLLGELKAAEAVETLIGILETDDDWMAESVPKSLAQIGEPALAPAIAVMNDTRRDSYTRSRAAAAVSGIARLHPDSRDVAIQSLVDALNACPGATEDEAAHNGFLVSELLDAHATRALGAIQRAYAEGRVDESIVDLDSVLSEFGLARAWQPDAPISPELEQRIASLAEAIQHGAKPAIADQQPAGSARRIGRNDPCWCGSGKKFKHCHGSVKQR